MKNKILKNSLYGETKNKSKDCPKIIRSKIFPSDIYKKHKSKDEVEKSLGDSEIIEENEKCPKCKGIMVTNYGPGISCTFCVDCGYNEYDYY